MPVVKLKPRFIRAITPRITGFAVSLIAFLCVTQFAFLQSVITSGLVRIPFSQKPKPPLQVLVFADDHSLARYANQTDHLACYAKRNGYTYRNIPPLRQPPCSNLTDVFFIKHCSVSYYLEKQPRGTYAVILDADTVPGAYNISLDRWVDFMDENDVDIAFYERSWNFEVMAGNYLVRNTPVGIGFMRFWSSFNYVRPPGFSSADNGAIHLAVIEAVGLHGREKCREKYHLLQALSTDLFPYYEFVACTKALLGPASVYPIMNRGVRKGGIAIFPRLFSFAVDARIWGVAKHRRLYPFHHGIKAGDWESDYVHDDKHGEKCHEYTLHEYQPDADIAERMKRDEQNQLANPMKEARVVPRWSAAWRDPTCFDRLWCKPTQFSDEWGPARIGDNASTIISKPGIDEVNTFIHRLEAGSDLTRF